MVQCVPSCLVVSYVSVFPPLLWPSSPSSLEEPALFWQHPLGPGGRVPQLDPVDGTVHENVGIEPGERAQVDGNGHATLPIDLDLG